MVTLTAGVTWLGTGPSAADDCLTAQARVGSPAAALCDELAKARLSDAAPLLGSESTHLALNAVRMAERIHLTGLVTPQSEHGLSDLGGFVATSAMPPVASEPVAGATGLLKLPALPVLPEAAPPTGRTPRPTDGRPRPADTPIDLTGPVQQAGDEIVDRAVPRVATELDRADIPGRSLDGVTRLLGGLSLR
ncbi:hypothetical protein OUY22_27940 [Nonomuraea sp. MCN248]|uniref:Uncharacterized protein n=1 Tax=Nonomuraea corallina TaxID=2989783 RepID=A0ABT4SJ74_9ACTN|nr:hypothetical protein [Nonomuraea corallina]MDA0637252.1 hypothetical protein [Nonomuraea corallina]